MNYNISNIYQLVIQYRREIYQYRLSFLREYYYVEQDVKEFNNQTNFSLNLLKEYKFNKISFYNEHIDKIIDLLKRFYEDNYKRKNVKLSNLKIRIWKKDRMSYLKINSEIFKIPLDNFDIFIDFWIKYNEYRKYNYEMERIAKSTEI